MAETLTAPVLVATLERLLDRERRRRRDAGLRRTAVATAIAVLVAAAWRIADRVIGREPMPVTMTLALVAFVAAVGLALLARSARGRTETEMAHDVDRRLGLDDRAAAALAVVRDGVPSRLAAYVVRDAEASLSAAAARVDVAFPVAVERRVTAPVRWLGAAAAVVAILAVLAELLVVGGPVRWLPGVKHAGGEPSADVPPSPDAPPEKGHGPGPDVKKPDEPEAKKPDEPETPKPPHPEGDIRVAMRMSKDEYDDKEPVGAAVAAAATGDISRPRTFDLRIAVDGVEVDTGVEMTVDPARPEGDRAEIDLRQVPGLKLAAGEHVARARLTTRTTHEEHASEPVKFTIRPPKDDDDKNDGNAPPKPKPKPKPEPKPQPEPQPQPEQPNEKKDDPAAQAPPPPPPVTDKHVVTPLFGEGDTVKKHGLVLVLDPGGGTETPPVTRPLGDALPDAKRRAEEAVDRARVSVEDRELVRRYFDLLEGLRK